MEFANTTKFLVLDGSNIMSWDNSKNMYLKVDGVSITPELIQAHGSSILPTSTTGLISNTPKVFAYSPEQGVVPTNITYRVLPEAKLVKMNTPILFSEPYIAGIQNVKYTGTVDSGAILKFIASADGGKTWYTFDTSWIPITATLTEVLSKGINHAALAGITAEAWGTIFNNKTIQFAWVMQIPNVDTKLVLNNIEITYNTK